LLRHSFYILSLVHKHIHIHITQHNINIKHKIEGGQGCLVGLKPIPKKKYRVSHPKSYQSCSVVHQGNNLERFIIGRQFLVVLVIFLINIMGESIKSAQPYPNILPLWMNMIFLDNSIALMITTIDIGQLPAQVNAAVAMLDFINN
jgi:hypothetical protein